CQNSFELSSHGLDVVVVHFVAPATNRNQFPPVSWTEKWTQKPWLPMGFRCFRQTVKNGKTIIFNSLRISTETVGTESGFPRRYAPRF
ncbi:MAG: hypothetical protein LBF51_00645, partial [Zoogloeaceae bacterium]|nr:hypothetical protein [Zoogloeaceae bacterium]